MSFLKRLLGFFSRWGDLSGPILILLTCIGLMFMAGLNRTLGVKDPLGIMGFTKFFEDKFYDLRVSAQLNPTWTDPDITIVTIDDKTLSKLGTWPIPRSNHARLIRRFQHFGAKVVALDILFPENSQDLKQDQDFVDAMVDYRKAGGELILAYSLTKTDPQDVPPEKGGDALTPTPDFVYNQSGSLQLNQPTTPFWVSRYTVPTDSILATEAIMGHIDSEEDPDGVFRNYRIIANIIDDTRESVYVSSMGLAMAEAFSGERAQVFTSDTGAALLTFKGKESKLDQLGEIKIRYSANRRNYREISYYDLLNAKDDDANVRALLEGRLVMVGSVAIGAHDFRNSPIDPKMAGMYAHTNIAHMLLHGFTYQPSDTSFTISIGLMALGFFILLLVQRRGNAILDIVVLGLIVASVIVADSRLFFPQGYELRLFYCLLCFFLTYSWTTFVNFWRAAKEKKQIKGTFARYVSPAIVNEMLDNPEKLKVGGEKRDITCLFSDVRDFTSISEGLTAQELSGALNQYMGRMTDIVFETKGTLDKYIGDAIVAFWGAPLDLEDHPIHAVTGAIKMMEALPAVNADFKARGLPEFKVGIGLNSGECSVGNMGSDKIFSYTALGDNMNLGARLEGLCKYYGAQILISEYTYARLPKDQFRARALDKVKVKGKTHPVQIFEVIHGVHPLHADPHSFHAYVRAYELFGQRDFAGARALLEEVLIKHPEDKPAVRLMKLSQKWLNEAVPEDFDVTTMTEK